MKKILYIIMVALPVLAVTAQVPKLRPLGGGTSMNAGRGSLKSGKDAVEEQKPAPTKDEPAGTLTRIIFDGPQSGWGITKTATHYYSADGKRLGLLPGGTLFDYSSVKTSSKNMVLEAKVKQGGAWEGPYLLDCSSLAIFEGKPDTVSPEVVANLTEYYALKSKLAERKAELENANAEKNGPSEAAKRAQEKYAESMKKATDLNAQSEKLTGSARSKTLEQLRTLKYEQTRLKQEADTEAAKYKAWKDANPLPPDVLKNDPEAARIELELAPLQLKVGKLVVE